MKKLKYMDIEFIKMIPKVEIHLHLEGAIPLRTVWKLLEKYNATEEIGSFECLDKRYQYRDFEEFLKTWVWQNQFLRDYEDFTLIASDVAEDLIKQNIIYAEIFYSPLLECRRNLDPLNITRAIYSGFKRHSKQIKLNLILDFCRDQGPDIAFDSLKKFNDIRKYDVIGIGLGGSEHKFPPEPFEGLYELAREFGLRTTVHAGEVSGKDSIWGAIKSLKVDRIGHGTSAVEDEILVKYLLEQNIPIELCPISNVKTSVVTSLSEHPIRDFFDKGLLVSVNTDDPKMFNTSLIDEYCELIKTFEFSLHHVYKFIDNAIKSAWCSNAVKSDLSDRLISFCKEHNVFVNKI